MDNSLKIVKAIKKINPNAKFTFGNNDLDTLQWVETTPIPVADIQAQLPIVEAEIEQEKQDAINKKASGKQKLRDLGLTDAEIKALIG
jgi:hypothetical protein